MKTKLFQPVLVVVSAIRRGPAWLTSEPDSSCSGLPRFTQAERADLTPDELRLITEAHASFAVEEHRG